MTHCSPESRTELAGGVWQIVSLLSTGLRHRQGEASQRQFWMVTDGDYPLIFRLSLSSRAEILVVIIPEVSY